MYIKKKRKLTHVCILSIDDFEVLQKAYVDLDIAKTISLSAKSNMKRRNILLRSARRRNKLDEIQAVKHVIYNIFFYFINYILSSVIKSVRECSFG